MLLTSVYSFTIVTVARRTEDSSPVIEKNLPDSQGILAMYISIRKKHSLREMYDIKPHMEQHVQTAMVQSYLRVPIHRAPTECN